MKANYLTWYPDSLISRGIIENVLSFFQASVVSILLYGCTTWTQTKRMQKSLTATTQECCKQFWTSPGENTPQSSNCTATYLPSRKTIQVKRTRHVRYYWRSRDELISDVLLWTPSYGRAKAGRPAITYIKQLCADTGCSPEDLPEAMNDRDGWRERVSDICADSVTWWWWFIFTIPSTSGRRWLEINRFKQFNRFEFSFPFPRPVTIPGFKNPICPATYP